jgi:hypothetical protein
MKRNPKHFFLGLEIFKDHRKRSYFGGLGVHLFNEERFEKASTTYSNTCSLKNISLGEFHADGLWKKNVNNGWNANADN